MKHNIEIELKKSVCKDCENLNYWDGYFCNIDIADLAYYNLEIINKHKNSLENKKECEHFIVRKPRSNCKTDKEICPFWCFNCEVN